jgi:hypothetical protein
MEKGVIKFVVFNDDNMLCDSNSQLSSEMRSCHLRDRTARIHDPDDA